jgi:hypothetical protein
VSISASVLTVTIALRDAEDRVGDDVLDAVDVLADARHHLARAVGGVEAHRLVHEAVEDLLAQP